MIRFSIIIPAYNAEPYIHELLECLDKQMTDETEVILIDDGSDKPLKLKKDYPWISHFSRHKNKGISYTRNKGLELAKGELINFLDADDMVSNNFISYILGRIDEEWDYMDLSWKSLEDDHFWFKLNSDRDSLSNPSASTRATARAPAPSASRRCASWRPPWPSGRPWARPWPWWASPLPSLCR